MFKIKCWGNPREYYQNKIVETFDIRCSYCGKETMIDVDILDITYQEIITTFVLNTMLHHIGMVKDKVFPFLYLDLFWDNSENLEFQVHGKKNQLLKYLN